jgi:hypothetical protein
LCKQEVIRWDKIIQKNGVSNEEDLFYKHRKNYEERINTFISLSPYVEKVKFFVIIQEWLKG